MEIHRYRTELPDSYFSGTKRRVDESSLSAHVLDVNPRMV